MNITGKRKLFLVKLVCAFAFAVFATHLAKDIWRDKFIRLSLTAQSAKPQTLQLFYCKHEDEAFSEKRSLKQSVRGDGKPHALEFRIPAGRLSKLRLDTGDGNAPVKISELRLSGKWGGGFPKWERRNHVKKLQEHDGNAFTVVPSGKDPYLVFPAEIADTARVVREYRLLLAFSIFSLSFLGAYLLVGFLLPRGNGEAKAADKVFFLCFAGMLVFPASKIDFKSEKSSENRNLAKWHELFADGKLNTQFGTQFESWFQDRFRARESLIRLHAAGEKIVGRRQENDQAFVGQNGWLFYKSLKDGNPIADFAGTNWHSPEELSHIKHNLLEQKAFLEKRGIKLVVMVPPNKESIYWKFFGGRYKRKNILSRTDLLVEFLREETDIPIVYPKSSLLDASRKYDTWYRDDTHWNSYGSFIGERELLAELGKIPRNRIVPETLTMRKIRSARGDLANMLNLPPYREEISVPRNPLQKEDGSIANKTAHDNPSAKNSEAVMLVGDSFREALAPWMLCDFKKLYVVHRHEFRQTMLDEFKPDILVLLFVERYSAQAATYSLDR